MKIIDYKMFDMTCEMPKALIKEGWQPYGSPYIDKDGRDCQAMVKYEEDYKKSLDDAPKAYDELLNNLIKLEKENQQLKKEIALLKMSPETVSYFERLEDDDLSKLKFKLYVSDKSIEALQKENEKLNSELIKLTEENRILNENNC